MDLLKFHYKPGFIEKKNYRNHLNRGNVTVPEVVPVLHGICVTLVLLWVLLRNHADSLRTLHVKSPCARSVIFSSSTSSP
jgi:hypothetical protein